MTHKGKNEAPTTHKYRLIRIIKSRRLLHQDNNNSRAYIIRLQYTVIILPNSSKIQKANTTQRIQYNLKKNSIMSAQQQQQQLQEEEETARAMDGIQWDDDSVSRAISFFGVS
jgi:type II secretory pathway component PulJ